MERNKTSPQDVEQVNRQANAPEDQEKLKREEETAAATHPTSGAAVQHAFAGALLTAEGGSLDRSETAESLKRAAENDGRV